VLGLETGAQVYRNGIRSGSVESIEVDPTNLGKVVVVIGLKHGTPIHTDAHALLQMAGITGGKLIDLQGGSLAAPVLAEGGTILTGKTTLDRLAAQAATLADEASAIAKQATEIMERATKVVDNVISLTDPARFDGVAGILKQAKTTTDNLAATSAVLHTIVAENRVAIKASLDTVHDAARSASELMDGPVAGILANANDFVSNLKGLVRDNEGQLRSAMFDLRQASRSFKELARDVRQRPSRLLFSSDPAERKLP
jgi:ABC-type transporter Mla subunit MlaD